MLLKLQRLLKAVLVRITKIALIVLAKHEFSQMMMLDCMFLIEHMLENIVGAIWLSKTTCDTAIFGS